MRSSTAALRPVRSRRGIALIITVVLLAFLLILVLGLVSMVRIETTISGNVQNQAVARQHALAGLDLAVSQLQKYAGLDSSVTARSDRDGNVAAYQKSLTGVWRENDNGENPPVWLVNDLTITDASSGLNPTGALERNEIYLVGNNSVASNDLRVRLPLSDIKTAGGDVIGRYAYWVGDEGVKASLGQTARFSQPQYNNSSAGTDYSVAEYRDRLQQFSLVRPYVEQGFPNAFDPDYSSTQAGLQLLKNRWQLAVLSSNPATNTPAKADIQARFHDFTVMSYGVLADTDKNNYGAGKNGALRVDLSDTANAGAGYKDYMNARPAATAATYLATYDVAPPVNPNAWPCFSISPVITEAGIRFRMLQPAGGNHNWNYSFSVELWNPYAATLRLPAGAKMRVRFVIPSTNITVTDGVSPEQVDVGGTYDIEVDTASGAVTWAPGQVLEFSGGVALVSSGTATDGLKTGGAATLATITEITNVAAMKPSNIILDDGTGNEWQNFDTTSLQFGADSTSMPVAAGWNWGWGFELVNDLSVFSYDDGSNSAQLRDPRKVDQPDGFFDTASGNWSLSAVTANTGGPSGGKFANNDVRVLFDLPRQEVTNLAQFRHLIATKPYELGNKWGGTTNSLFDSAFVSTVPQGAYDWLADYRNGVAAAQALANPYLTLCDPIDPWPANAATKASLQSRTEAARYFLVRGAFNVNSTSEEAWKAVLGSKLAAWLSEASGPRALNHAFFRVPHGAQQLNDLDGAAPVSALPSTTEINSNGGLPIRRAAGRQLTNLEVANLAAKIVAELKARYAANKAPFKSLSEFITDGLIERAIVNTASQDDPDKSLNEVINAAENRGFGGGLTQADVIAAITPFMSVRSDTFVVRSYGNVVNPTTGDVEGRAYCEAVVQRVPDLVADLQAATSEVMNPTAANNPFGRKFKVISFRWLSPSDI